MKKLGEVKEYIKHNKYVLILLYIPIFVLSFMLVERLVPSGSDYWATDLPIDSKIPFVEAFVIPYCLWYPYLIVMGLYLLAHDVPEFKRYAAFIISGFTLCLLFCALDNLISVICMRHPGSVFPAILAHYSPPFKTS